MPVGFSVSGGGRSILQLASSLAEAHGGQQFSCCCGVRPGDFSPWRLSFHGAVKRLATAQRGNFLQVGLGSLTAPTFSGTNYLKLVWIIFLQIDNVGTNTMRSNSVHLTDEFQLHLRPLPIGSIPLPFPLQVFSGPTTERKEKNMDN